MKSRSILNLVMFLGLVSFVSGCASARVVSVRPGEGGIIALGGMNQEEAREKATVQMQQNCGSKKIKIVSEGEEVIGTVSSGNAGAYSGYGRNSAYGYSNSSTTNKTEWRITYECQAQ